MSTLTWKPMQRSVHKMKSKTVSPSIPICFSNQVHPNMCKSSCIFSFHLRGTKELWDGGHYRMRSRKCVQNFQASLIL
jgi:hypothetical protein